MGKIKIMGLVIVIMLGCLLFKESKYEGMTAEEWFNAYDYESERSISLEYELDDLNEEFNDLNKEYEDFKDCVEYYEEDAVYYCD